LATRSVSVAVAFATLLLFSFTTAGQQGTVPRLIVFTGVLNDHNLRPLTGVTGIRIAIYKDQHGGTPLWTEVQNVSLDEQGRYNMLLGSTHGAGMPMELFISNEPRWVGVQALIAGEEEQPRVLLVSVPYALKAADADTIGGKPASAFVMADNSADAKKTATTHGAASSPNPAVVSGAGMPNKLTKWQDTLGTLADSAVFESGGKVGIGTTVPLSTLNVVTNGAPDYITLSAYQADLFDKGFLVRSTRGVPGAPAAVQNGNTLFNLYAQGFDGVDYSISGGLTMSVDGAVSVGKTPGAILFNTADSNGTYAERMRVSSSGNVGIGTSSPTAKLEVNGQVKATYFVGDGSQLTNLPGGGSGGPATNVICSQPCVSSSEIEDGTIVDADISSSAAIAPAKIAGIAAILGANTFTDTQTIGSGNLALSNGNFGLPSTTGANKGVLTFGGSPFMHTYGTNNTFVGLNAGNFTTTGVSVLTRQSVTQRSYQTLPAVTTRPRGTGHFGRTRLERVTQLMGMTRCTQILRELATAQREMPRCTSIPTAVTTPPQA
jgi:hypothetical protein